MLKRILLGVLAILLALVIIGFYLPDRFEIKRQINIIAPLSYVYEEINELERWSNWSYWQANDPEMQITYDGRKSGIRAGFNWEGDGGSGRLMFVENWPDTSVVAEIYLTEKDTAVSTYKLKHRNDTTFLSIVFNMHNFNNPFSRLMAALIIKPKIEKAFRYELSKIKDIAEEKPIFTIQITEESLAPTYCITATDVISPNDKEKVFIQQLKMFNELKMVLQKSKSTMIGRPFCLFPSHKDQSVELVCAITIPPDSKIPPEYPIIQHYSGTAIKGIHLGSYSSLGNTHDEIKTYIAYKKYKMNGSPWEVYITDPQKQPDVNKWVTEVYYPVK